MGSPFLHCRFPRNSDGFCFSSSHLEYFQFSFLLLFGELGKGGGHGWLWVSTWLSYEVQLKKKTLLMGGDGLDEMVILNFSLNIFSGLSWLS